LSRSTGLTGATFAKGFPLTPTRDIEMLEHESTVQLRKLLVHLSDDPIEEQRLALRESVHDFVDASKDRGAPIERVIIALKQLANEAGLESSAEVLSYRRRPSGRDALLMQLVRWAVERYFGYERPPSSRNDFGAPKPPGPRGGSVMAPFIHRSARAFFSSAMRVLHSRSA
jgi:hypothetical protein